jgi:type VI secretion system ImpM family protein
VEQPAAVSIPEPVLKPVSQPVPEPVLKPVSQPVPEPVLKPVSQPAPEPVLKPVSQTVPTPAPAEQPATTPGEDDGTDIHIAPRSQGLLRASRFPHACYGKLPIFGDFIRDRNNLPEIHAMDIWFQEGILAARQFDRNWDAGFTNAPTSRFLYASPDSRNVIAGVWVASVDKAGRRYPFLIYTIAPAQELGSLPQLYPLYFSDFFHHAQELAEKGWKGQDLRTFGAKVEALSWHQDFDAGRAKYQEYLMKQKAGDLWKRLFGAADHPATMLLPLNLQSALLPMRTGSAGGMKTVLRFPRRKGVEPTLLVDLAMRMSGRTQHPTLVTWTDESLTILYPKLSPKFYALLMQPALAGEAVSDLAKDGADDAGFLQRARERFGAVATNPNITLGQLLQGLTGR